MSLITEKSEIIFLYESKYSIPNGDPFSGGQRYDEETKKILVSDVRIKRFIRDYLQNIGELIYVANPDLDNKMTAGQRFKFLYDSRADKNISPRDFAYSLIDVRLFGAVIPIQKDKSKKSSEGGEEANAFNVTGPVQFALLNPSLNAVNLLTNQRTSVFVSKEGNNQGSISTRELVPYGLLQINGWINPYVASKSKLMETDVNKMLSALWLGANDFHTSSKSQNSLLLIQLIYNQPNDKIYGTDKLISLKAQKKQEELRDLTDFELDFENLKAAAASPKVKEIRFYTEIDALKDKITALGSDKIKPLDIQVPAGV